MHRFLFSGYMNRGTVFPTILHVRPAKTEINLRIRLISFRCPAGDASDPWLPTECPAETDPYKIACAQ